MDPRNDRLAQEVISAFAEQNSIFGLNSLMGRILGLLFLVEEEQSLDDIADKLEMSKGPISQVCRQLRDNNLIEKVWVPGDRKDYYKPVNDLLGRLYQNQNKRLDQFNRRSNRMERQSENRTDPAGRHIRSRIRQMKAFYGLLTDYNDEFLEEWRHMNLQRAPR